MLLPKGFEVELFTGRFSGESVGLAQDIAETLPYFVCEPDNRNVQYITPPLTYYDRILGALIEPRRLLRHYLRSLGDYTILPGSTLSLGHTNQFYRSTPDNPYHTCIEQTYGTDVVTASVHINIGIPDTESLLRTCRLIRLEAPLFLALSASSPFLDDTITGLHSTRWHLCPKTPAHVPFFSDHQHFVTWTKEQLSNGAMQNVRHLWCSVRPSGTGCPYSLNRLELRISDLVSDPLALLAITTLLEMRILMLFNSPKSLRLDPLEPGTSKFTPDELIEITAYNEQSVAAKSLDAMVVHWQTGEWLSAREWLFTLYEQVQPLAKENNVDSWLKPILRILDEGNEAQQWLKLYAEGEVPGSILSRAIQTVQHQEMILMDELVAA